MVELSCPKKIGLSFTWKFARNLKGLRGLLTLEKLSLSVKAFMSLLSVL